MTDAGFIFIYAIVVALSYTYFISSNLPKGIYRFISLLPIFYLFTILPLLLSSAVTTVVATIFITWLTNFKLLLFTFNLGPLTSPKYSLIQFITIASLPVVIEPHFFNPKKKSHLYFLIQSLVFPFLINFTYNHKHELNPNVISIIHITIVFLMLDLLFLTSNAIVIAVAGVAFEPPSDEPYLSTSIQDFWGRRWDLMVTNNLRHTIYKPVKSVFPGTAPAVMATFAVSGLLHELMLYYVTRVSPTWDMTLFFVLHGMCLVVEIKVKRAVSGIFELPAVVSRVLTMGFLFLTGSWLFFPAFVKSGADVKVLDELKLFIDYGKCLFG